MMWIPFLLLQGLLGLGLLRRLQPRSPDFLFRRIGLAFLVGLPASSLLLFLMELARVPILAVFFFVVLLVAAIAVNLPPRMPVLQRPSAALSEIPFLILILFLLAESVWKGIFVPGLPRDAIVGMDLVAKIAVEEGTIASSVFTGPELAGRLSNQPFYAPFVMLMQLTFRLAGEPLGKVWHSVLFVSFTVFLYSWVRERLHPVFAGLLTVFFLTVPIIHSYSYFVITDLANAIFFGVAAAYLHRYLRSRELHDLATASVFMTAVAWSRSEAVLLVPYGALLLFFAGFRAGTPGRLSLSHRLRDAVLFGVPPVAAFALWHVLYFNLYLGTGPVNQVRGGLMSPDAFLDISSRMLSQLGDHTLYGSLLYLFLLVLAVDLFRFRGIRGLGLIGWIPYIFVMFVFVIHVFPAASVNLTVKRGFMKLFPVMILAMAESPSLKVLSKRLSVWEKRK